VNRRSIITLSVLVAIMLGLLYCYSSYRRVIIRGGSLEPYYQTGDSLIVRLRSHPTLGDIIVFRMHEELLAKCVRGIPGDMTDLGVVQDGHLYVTGTDRSGRYLVPEEAIVGVVVAAFFAHTGKSHVVAGVRIPPAQAPRTVTTPDSKTPVVYLRQDIASIGGGAMIIKGDVRQYYPVGSRVFCRDTDLIYTVRASALSQAGLFAGSTTIQVDPPFCPPGETMVYCLAK